jgi:hypothetical protein
MFVCSQCDDQKTKWSGMTVGKAEQEGMAMIYLLNPSPIIGAGPMSFVADGKTTRVAKLRIEQLFAIPLTGKVVVPCPVMAMPLFLFLCQGVANAHARADAKKRCGKQA